MVLADHKTCPRCELEKPVADFHADASKSTGLASYCKECAKQKTRDWAEANPEQKRVAQRGYYVANRERVLAASSAWRKANPEKVAEQQQRHKGIKHAPRDRRAYAKAHPEIARKQSQMRRARLAKAVIIAGVAEYERLTRLDPCSYCGHAGGTADHIVPLTAGGNHGPMNITGACHACNSGKRDTSLLHYLIRKVGV